MSQTIVRIDAARLSCFAKNICFFRSSSTFHWMSDCDDMAFIDVAGTCKHTTTALPRAQQHASTRCKKNDVNTICNLNAKGQ
uniref:Uncharacterized protein n=1 Tax=Rhipicephalus appendiculatus TaxID=34631 RepID=A0A131YAU1_RHIAP